MSRSLLVMVAGPYRSGTGDDPEKIARNLARLEEAALEVWKLGHLAVIGEWLALPLMQRAGSKAIGDAAYEAFSYPLADRLLAHCDAVLRLPGASVGADGDVEVAGMLGLPVYRDLKALPPGGPVRRRSS